MTTIIAFVIVAFFLGGCSNNTSRRETLQKIKKWENREIIFPSELLLLCQQQDSSFASRLKNKYKILHYIDSSGCTPCKLTLFEWNQLLKTLQDTRKEVAFVFIISTNDSTNIMKINKWKELHKCPYPIFYDRKNLLDDKNKFINDPMFQTFLLDQNNKVILIGNPVGNTDLQNLYKKTIHS